MPFYFYIYSNYFSGGLWWLFFLSNHYVRSRKQIFLQQPLRLIHDIDVSTKYLSFVWSSALLCNLCVEAIFLDTRINIHLTFESEVQMLLVMHLKSTFVLHAEHYFLFDRFMAMMSCLIVYLAGTNDNFPLGLCRPCNSNIPILDWNCLSCEFIQTSLFTNNGGVFVVITSTTFSLVTFPPVLWRK